MTDITELSPEIQAICKQLTAEVDRVIAANRREEYLKLSRAGEIMGCHADTVSKLIREGKLKSVGEGKLTRVPRSSIDAYFVGAGS